MSNFYISAKKIFHLSFLFLLLSNILFAQVKVRGYYRKNGTYVRSHIRSNPDGNPYNNYSYPGNVNPYTGVVASGNSVTYLANYYNSSSSNSTHSRNESYSNGPSLSVELQNIVDEVNNAPKTSSYLKDSYNVIAVKTYFYDSPSFSSNPRKAYLVFGEIVFPEYKYNEFVYVKFTNAKGNITQGWIKLENLL